MIACPEDYAPDPRVLAEARLLGDRTGADLTVLHNPRLAVGGADAVYADVWASMGSEHEQEARHRALAPFQVTEELMALAKPEAIFLHCLGKAEVAGMSRIVVARRQCAVRRGEPAEAETRRRTVLPAASELAGSPAPLRRADRRGGGGRALPRRSPPARRGRASSAAPGLQQP